MLVENITCNDDVLSDAERKSRHTARYRPPRQHPRCFRGALGYAESFCRLLSLHRRSHRRHLVHVGVQSHHHIPTRKIQKQERKIEIAPARRETALMMEEEKEEEVLPKKEEKNLYFSDEDFEDLEKQKEVEEK